ncbi:MAG: YcxB family protein [Acetobacter sp.]|nr:YcxB family protein [Bacteroides sp.]MCM1340377.1 YcxB family protein [Acetobacter sp.]MCM1432976.1 YcxB family protein [Clostridiales bacterium]
MGKIKFSMSAQDYYYGYKFKLKATKFKSNIWWIVLLADIILAVSVIVFKLWSISFLAGMLLIFSIFMIAMPTKKMCMSEYNASPFNNKCKSIMFDESFISFISAFEKITMSWQDICAYSINDRYIIILPLASSELYVINKEEITECKHEIETIADLLNTKSRKINISNSIPKSEKALVQNEEAEEKADVFPFSINSAVDFDDSVKNQKLSFKRNRTMPLFYILILVQLAFGVYDYITHKDAQLLIITAAFTAFTLVTMLFFYFVLTRRNAKKVAKADKFSFLQRKICFEKNFIEIITDSDEKNIKINKIIPYDYIQSVIESEEYFSIFASSEKQLLVPKRYLNGSQISEITQKLKDKCFYSKIK